MFKAVKAAGEKFLRLLKAKRRHAVRLQAFGTGDADSVSQQVAPPMISASHFHDVLFTGCEPRDS